MPHNHHLIGLDQLLNEELCGLKHLLGTDLGGGGEGGGGGGGRERGGGEKMYMYMHTHTYTITNLVCSIQKLVVIRFGQFYSREQVRYDSLE